MHDSKDCVRVVGGQFHIADHSATARPALLLQREGKEWTMGRGKGQNRKTKEKLLQLHLKQTTGVGYPLYEPPRFLGTLSTMGWEGKTNLTMVSSASNPSISKAKKTMTA
jgi:hypothetical protein